MQQPGAASYLTSLLPLTRQIIRFAPSSVHTASNWGEGLGGGGGGAGGAGGEKTKNKKNKS